MKNKKTLIMLLLIPFVVGLVTFISVFSITHAIAADIDGIEWKYNDYEGLRTNSEMELEATPVSSAGTLLADGADVLVFDISRVVRGASDTTVEVRDGKYYVVSGEQIGEVMIRCSNSIGSVSKEFNLTIYDRGAILVNNAVSNGGSNIDKSVERYYGEYDIAYNEGAEDLLSYEETYIEGSQNHHNRLSKQGENGANYYTLAHSSIPLNITFLSDDSSSELVVETENCELELGTIEGTSRSATIKFGDISEDTKVTIKLTMTGAGMEFIETTRSYMIVNEGVNVRSYNDLMMCTNLSEEGMPVCLQINLQSRLNALNTTSTQVDDLDNPVYNTDEIKEGNALFGNINSRESGVTQRGYNNNAFNYEAFLDYVECDLDPKWAVQTGKITLDEGETGLTKKVLKVGIHVKKDFYGNGFTINTHELCYPVSSEGIDAYGKVAPGPYDYFTGPISYLDVSLAMLPDITIVEAYLNDNISFLVDGDGITVNDVNLRNSDNVDVIEELTYTGIGMETRGDNITVSNSVVQNARTCVRSFSCDNLLFDNCLFQNSAEFLMKLGAAAEDILYTDSTASQSRTYSYTDQTTGQTSTLSLNDYMGTTADMIAGNTPATKETDGGGLAEVRLLQDKLDYDMTSSYIPVTVNDCFFYGSGTYSIALETSFNGAYLYNGMLPNIDATVAGQTLTLRGLFDGNVTPPNNIGGSSKPIELTLSGDTRFYDWANIDSAQDLNDAPYRTMDLTTVINENLSPLLTQLADQYPEQFSQILELLGLTEEDLQKLNIDSFFPVKSIIFDYAKANGLVYEADMNSDGNNESYINRPIAYYGGGDNQSRVINNITTSDTYGAIQSENAKITVDHASHAYSATGSVSTDNLFAFLMAAIEKCVVYATGTNPFYFITNERVTSGTTPATFTLTSPGSDELKNRTLEE